MFRGVRLRRCRRNTDHRISYGSDDLQFGALRLPETPGPYAVIVFIHGGCWLNQCSL